MKALILGDLFITNDLLIKELEKVFAGTGIEFEYTCRTDEWPVKPVEQNNEVREYCGPDEDLIPLVKDAEIILTHTACITKRVIDSATRLKAIAAARGGPVNINIKACTKRGIPVFYAPGRNSGAVAEFTIGLILAETRSIARSHSSLFKEKKWRGDLYVLDRVGLELNSSVVGIIGFGAIGQKVAAILKGFGSQILVYDPYTDAFVIERAGCNKVEFDELMRRSDVVSLHCRYNEKTKGMIGEEEIGLMKKTAYLINTARGELIDHDALYKALKEKRIAGAALDVFESEPPPHLSPIYQLDNVTATTHLGGASIQAAEIGARIAVEEIYSYITGSGKIRFLANPEVFTNNQY
ncbi:MAG: 2-hydroxyacid dehydrogenase [Clostridia bacterium]|nr:2-hydroxyacid dehydrogenase [Clostridia bacterium]